MISGKNLASMMPRDRLTLEPAKTARRVIAAVLCAVGMLMAGMAQAEVWNVDTLMQLLAQTKSSRASFVEQKYLSAVEVPLESSGELLYLAPDRLEKRTLKPRPESLVLDKEVLIFERQGRKRSLALQSYPQVGAFVESIRATLAGDRKALDRNYRVELQGKRERWQLLLYPLDAKAAQLVNQVRLSGQRDHVEVIEILQGNGDRSVMEVTPQSGPAPVVGEASSPVAVAPN